MYLCFVKKLHLAISYLKYLIKSKNEHSVHSPFVFDLATNVIYKKTPYYAYPEVEKVRAELLVDKTEIAITDLGAVAKNKYNKRVQQIAKTSLKQTKYAQLIFRLVNHFQPTSILELGTSLGITTSYMALANPKAKVTSIEGSKAIAEIANQNFTKLSIENINSVVGNFDAILQSELDKFEKLDFVFFDGNHRKQATLNYFNLCLQKKHSQSVFIFDDIYWSAEMTEAWEEIKNHHEVTVSIDLFHLGIIFFRTEQVKQHFIIRF